MSLDNGSAQTARPESTWPHAFRLPQFAGITNPSFPQPSNGVGAQRPSAARSACSAWLGKCPPSLGYGECPAGKSGRRARR